MTAIVIPIFADHPDEAMTHLRAAAASGADMVELRCDRASLETVRRLLRQRPESAGGKRLPVIVTFRSVAEGGGFSGTDEMLACGVEIAAAEQAAYVDIEFAAWRRSEALRRRAAAVCGHPDGAGPRVILSAHDFSGRPADLRERVQAMAETPGHAVVKIAWKAANVAEAVEALQLVEEVRQRYGREMVALTMGESGQLSRLLAAKFRQPFTFATLSRGEESAPGQPTVAELRGLYRWEAQASRTAVCGVIGWPVGHSMSPAIHNAGFEQVGFDGVYVPLPVEPAYETFASAVDALRDCPGMNLRGLSVTIPHKEHAIRYVRERGGRIDELSAHIGVINTIIFETQGQAGRLYGLNTDYAGALDALAGAMGKRREDLAGKRAAVLGAGGAARAIVAGLAHYGAATVIYNRTPERARALAEEFNGTPGEVAAALLESLSESCCDVYINCTPLGMHPKIEGCPVPEDMTFSREKVAFDTIYNPLETKFLRIAAAQGATTVPGVEMFVRQGAIQFEHFTGRPAPVDTFRAILRKHLQPPW